MTILPIDPVANGIAGRDEQGRFASGNRFAKGNPLAAKVARLRGVLMDALDAEDGERLRNVVSAMLTKAEGGDVAAARLCIEYAIGKPLEHDMIERVERIEETIAQKEPR